MKDAPDKPIETQANPGKLNPLQIVASVFAAGLGVQSSKNRERDFKQGRIGVFIAAGIAFTLFFVVSVMLVVQMVIKNTGE